MKNFIKENWFKLSIVFLLLVGVILCVYQLFRPLSERGKMAHCLELNTDLGVKTCIQLLIKQKIGENTDGIDK